MSRKKKKKQSPLLVDGALSYEFSRSRVAKRHINNIVPARLESAFGHLTPNWLGAGMMAHTLRAIFESDEPQFVEERQKMRKKGFRQMPQQLDFDILALIEASFPELISRDDLSERLNRSKGEVGHRLRYLRHFAAKMLGVNILSNYSGSVGIADANLWLLWQNRMAKLANGVRDSQEKHGMSLKTVVNHQITIQQELPTIQPIILTLEEGSDD